MISTRWLRHAQLMAADELSPHLLASWSKDVLHRLHQSALSAVSELGLQADIKSSINLIVHSPQFTPTCLFASLQTVHHYIKSKEEQLT